MTQRATAEIYNRNELVEVGLDESALILIRHCRDMKRQEACLRLITLLLLFSCTALFVVTNGVELRQQEEGAQIPALAKQVAECSIGFTDDAQNQIDSSPVNIQLNDGQNQDSSHMRIELRIYFEDNVNHHLLKWKALFGKNYYNDDKNAIVIPQNGFYFVYVRIAFGCPDTEAQQLHVKLYRWTEQYKENVVLTHVWDACSNGQSRNVFVGQQFDLSKGYHLSVEVEEGYDLIGDSSVFGAFRT